MSDKEFLEGLILLASFQIPITIEEAVIFRTGSGKTLYYVCPRCCCTIEREYMYCCDRCGQRLDWHFHQKIRYRVAGELGKKNVTF